jgi:glutamate/tyrosine decarboxylase-like PLP-dependent enzyme
MDELRPLLAQAASLAADFYDSLPERPVYPHITVGELRNAFQAPLPEEPTPATQVIAELAAAADRGVVATAGGRFFGFVIGGSLPASLAADFLTSAWDQNAGLYVGGPAASVVEEVAGAWSLELLGLPRDASFAFVTGGQMANFTGLAAARHHVLARAGWDVERDGLTGAPRIRVVVGAKRHGTIDRALRMLGLGAPTDIVPADDNGRLLADGLELTDEPTILCAQAGEVNTGAFDPFHAIADARDDAANTWVHVDGAFGLWAAVSPELRHLVDGVERADSWATDAHKCGLTKCPTSPSLRRWATSSYPTCANRRAKTRRGASSANAARSSAGRASTAYSSRPRSGSRTSQANGAGASEASARRSRPSNAVRPRGSSSRSRAVSPANA